MQAGAAGQKGNNGKKRGTSRPQSGGQQRGQAQPAQRPQAEYRPPPNQFPERPQPIAGVQLAGQVAKLSINQNINVGVGQQVVGANTFVKRPGFGTMGKAMQIYVNVFKIEVPDIDINRYDVIVKDDKSDRIPKDICRKIFESWKKMDHTNLKWSAADYDIAKSIAYDGQKLLYSPKPLKGITGVPVSFSIEYIEEYNDQPRNFTVIMKKIASVNMEVLHQYLKPAKPGVALDIPYEAISAFEVLLRQSPALRFTTNPAGRAFYNEDSLTALPGGIDIHYGWYQSLRPGVGSLDSRTGMTYKTLLMNLDVVASCFYTPGPLINVIAKFFGKRSIEECKDLISRSENVRSLQRFLNLVNIEINYRTTGRRKYKIAGLSRESIAKSTNNITGADGKEYKTTHADYFRQTYNLNLKYTWLPAILYGKKLNGIPIELCNVIPNQRYAIKISDIQAADMVKVTAVKPELRKTRIMDGMTKLHGQNDAALLDQWGVKINLKAGLMTVDARVLQSPRLLLGGGKPSAAQGGQWRMGKGNGFAKAATLCAWSVAVFGDKKYNPINVIGGFLETVEQQLRGMGVQVQWPDGTEEMVVYETRGNVKRTLEDAKNVATKLGKRFSHLHPSSSQRVVDIVICIVPRRDTIAETELSLMTQVVLSKHVQANKPAYSENLVLKINAKLGGSTAFVSPQDLPFLRDPIPTIVFGMDVTHPPPGVTNGVSIAALVASIDKKAQVGRKEIVEEMSEMFIELFKAFKVRNGMFPQRVLFYRDGVSEGQFGEVVYTEVQAMKKSFVKLGCPEDKMPKITFLSVNKRHHIRFFPMKPADADRSGNVNSGTVIDTGVAHPYEFDFFLNSHAGLQGTSRPTHYHVLFDENNFTADNLQLLTYRMCFLYCRCSKAVSIVPAAYYAHLVAARARCYMTEGGSDSASVSSSVLGDSILVQVEKEIANSMFFV